MNKTIFKYTAKIHEIFSFFNIDILYNLINILEKIPLTIMIIFMLYNLLYRFIYIHTLELEQFVCLYFIGYSIYLFIKIRILPNNSIKKIVKNQHLFIEGVCKKCKKYKIESINIKKPFYTKHCNICKSCFFNVTNHCLYLNTCINICNINEYYLFLNTFGFYLILSNLRNFYIVNGEYLKIIEFIIGIFLNVFMIFKLKSFNKTYLYEDINDRMYIINILFFTSYIVYLTLKYKNFS